MVEACVAPGVSERLPAPGVLYQAFVDPSGGSSDSFTLAIAHRDGDTAILDAVRERRPPFSPEQVVVEFAELLRRYNVLRVSGDRYAGQWPAEQFAKRGITYEPATRTASDIYRDTLPLLNSGSVELLDNPTLVNQLCSLERRTSRLGKDTVTHPPHGHDDLANAVAGVLVLASRPRQRLITRVLDQPDFGGPSQVLVRGDLSPPIPFSPPPHWHKDPQLMAASRPKKP